ncbi:AAA family ATPase [Thiobacillus thioparus]|uniref:AAA family ATPase n=1 Tax=Thiobacillus thioparus TaxID=931 RepID=UPI00036D97B1|nr:AAA family ATPase [Thiobacillus thioparus]
MGKTLTEIAQQLKNADKKVQLIYGFNGMGKTRLSREFKQMVAPKSNDGEGDGEADQPELSRNKILYYNAFTEDLFYWDNDLEEDAEPKLRIQPNTFTDWVLKDQGQDMNVITTFQRYTNDKLTPHFNAERKDDKTGEVIAKVFSEVTFTMERGDATHSGNLKISKGEESNFIWSIFYALLEQVIGVLNIAEPSDRETDQFNQLEYVFIDDPVSSLDDNHLIQLAVDLAQLVKLNDSNVKFIISTHNPLFFNVLCNEFGSDEKTERYSWKSKWFSKSRLEKNGDGSLHLAEQPNDSPFAYHLHLISQLEEAIKSGQIEKYHFNLLRNILEKTATFLGYKRWEHLLPETDDGLPNPYAKRIVNFSSHSKHAAEEVSPLKPEEKQVLEKLVKHVVERHRFWQEKIT